MISPDTGTLLKRGLVKPRLVRNARTFATIVNADCAVWNLFL